MHSFRRILLCTDFSPNSENALVYAIQLASDLGAKLTVLHAYRLLQPSVPPTDKSPFSIKNQWEKATKEQFGILEKSHLKNAAIQYDFELGVGFATDAIVDYVENNEIDLVIVGKNGKGNLGRLFGSTTEVLFDLIECPLLVVPSGARYNQGIKSAVFAYRFEEVKDESNLLSVTGVFRELHVFLDILRVVSKGEEFRLNGEAKSFEKYLIGIEHAYNVISGDDIEQSILDYITKSKTDLLVTMHKKRNLLESILSISLTKKLSLHSNLPLLTFG